MEISFKNLAASDLENALCREWIESDERGNYSSSSVIGLNTRKKHGLFVAKSPKQNSHSVLLSHLQEEFYLGKKIHPIYAVEYESSPYVEGLDRQDEFLLDPFPSFIYQFENIQIKKSVFFVADESRLLISYHFSGLSGKKCRFVIRPYFAFRDIEDKTDPELFDNLEFYFTEDQLRFLPFPEAPELFIQFSEGNFNNAPMWFHNFFYRYEQDSQGRTEDLLNPGFFEIELSKNTQIYLSIGLEGLPTQTLSQIYEEELNRRQTPGMTLKNENEIYEYISKKTENFRKYAPQNFKFYSVALTDTRFNLTLFCLMATRLIQAGMNKRTVETLYKELQSVLKNKDIHEVLMGMHRDIIIDPSTPFLLIFFIYHYHRKFHILSTAPQAVHLISEIINLIRKNQLHFYRIKRNRLLQREYKKSDVAAKDDYEIFFPIRQNFILNAFWYNIMRMGLELAEMADISMRKFQKWPAKIKSKFYQLYFKSFAENPPQIIDSVNFILHPALVFAVSLPFPILDEKESKILYRILMTQFLTKGGIKIPIRRDDQIHHYTTSLFLGEYAHAWSLLGEDRDLILQFFDNIVTQIKGQLQQGMLGYLPNMFPGKDDQPQDIRRPSGVAMTETLHFLYNLEKIRENK